METPFVDRAIEISELRAVLDSAKSGNGAIFLITGETGIGKTRLMEEFCKIAENEGFRILFSRCIDTKAAPFLPLYDAFRHLEAERTLEPVPLGLFMLGEISTEKLYYAERERARKLESFLRKFEQLAAEKPVVFVIDDLQWADSGTLSFLHYLSRNISKVSMVCLAAYATEFLTTGSSSRFAETVRNIMIERNARTIKIKNLQKKEVAEILHSIVSSNMPEKLLAAVYEKTGGNPLFVEELGKNFRELGAFDAETMRLRIPLEKIDMPETVKSLVGIRISRLSEEAKKVLRACAVLGREFEYMLLTKLVELTEEKLLVILDNLLISGYIEEVPGGEEKYRFVHNPVYEWVYSEISTPRKRIMHRIAGIQLERLHSNEPVYYSDLGKHFIIAREFAKGVKYKVLAAEFALSSYSIEDAVANLKEAEGVLGEIEDENERRNYGYRLYSMLGDCHYFLSMYDESINAYQNALTFVREKSEEMKVKLKLSMPHTKKGNFDESVHLLSEVLDFASPDDPAHTTSALMTLGWTYELKGEFQIAVKYYQQALNNCEKMNDEVLAGAVFHRVGTGHWCTGNILEARKALERALEIRKKHNVKEGLADTYNNLAILYSDEGEIKKAIEHFKEAEKLYMEIGELSGLCAIYNNLADIYALRGEYEEAIKIYWKDVELSRRIGYKTSEIMALSNIASIYQETEDYKTALEHYKRALAESRKIGEKRMLTTILSNLAVIYAELGEVDKALSFAEEAMRVAVEVGNKEDEGDACSATAKVLVSMGKFEEAEAHYSRALDLYVAIQRAERVYTCRYDMGKLYTMWGKYGMAKENLEKAREFFEQMGSKGMLEKINRELEKIQGK
ncbi:MAG: tetratricopeptide repeat protein [Thermoplasmata archaeon]|nr:tetratricopeptide repeat protein [Thermoplasmata archaeon]